MSDAAQHWKRIASLHESLSGSDTEFVQTLSWAIEDDAWRDFTKPIDGLQLYSSFPKFLREEMGLSVDDVRRRVQNCNDIGANRIVRRVLETVPQPWPMGANQHGGVSDTQPSSDQAARDAMAILSRLKRDAPELAEQVMDGDLTANAAAVKMGWRKQYARIRTDDVQRAMKVLLEHFDVDDVREALDALDTGGDDD